MLRLILLSCAGLCFLMLSSCGGSSYLLTQRAKAMSEAELLKTEVSEQGIADENTAAADSLLVKAQQLKVSSSSPDAVYYANLAAAHYRVALARRSVALSQAALTDASRALKSSEEKVQKYESILAEIRTSAEPEGGE